MAAKRIFYITASELTLFSCHKGVVSEVARYDASDEGRAAFSAHLEQHPGDPSTILVDVIEEEYRMETIPHVSGGDRQHLLERKLTKVFRRSPFSAAQVQGREKEGRRDDLVMCAALTNSDVVESWLVEVRNHKVPLAGVFSISMMTEKLLKKLQIKHDNVLVLSLQQDKNLRQSFFASGKLKISRLSPLSLSDANTYVTNIQNEVERNHRYVNRLRLLPFNEPLDICLFASSENMARYNEALQDSRSLRYHAIDINEAARNIGLKQTLQEGQCEWLYAHLASLVTPSINYASQGECRYYRMFQMRRGAIAASVMLSLSGLLYCGGAVLDAWKTKAETENTVAKIAQVEQRHAVVLATLPPMQFSPKVIRETVEIDARLSGSGYHPQFMMTLLGKTLTRFPDIQLDEVSWKIIKPEEQPQDDDLVMDEEGNVIEPIHDESRVMQMVTIKARLEPQIKKYQSAFNKIEQFISELKRHKDLVKVNAISLPLNVDPASTLQGESGVGMNNPTAFFEIEAVMRVGES